MSKRKTILWWAIETEFKARLGDNDYDFLLANLLEFASALNSKKYTEVLIDELPRADYKPA